MKHPVTGPRVTAILILLLAGLVSSRFFGRHPESDISEVAELEVLPAPLDEPLASRAAPPANLRQASATVSIELDDATPHKLPNWALQQPDDLDRFIHASPASPLPKMASVKLEPLSTWVDNKSRTTRSTDNAQHWTTPVRSDSANNSPGTTEKGVASAVGLSSVRSGAALRPEAARPEEVVAREIHQPGLEPSEPTASIEEYRSSPWENEERFEQSIQSWSTVGGSPAASTPIRWPDQQLAVDQLQRLRTLPAETRTPAAQIATYPSDTQASTVHGVSPEHRGHVNPDAPPRSFVFQPGIQAQR